MRLFRIIWMLVLTAGVSMSAYAQPDTVCVADPYGFYSVDTGENAGAGTLNAQYDWVVIPPGAVVTPDQGVNGSSNAISVDWSSVAPGNYTLEVIETDLITQCVGEPVQLQVVVLEPLGPVIVCTPISSSQVNFEWAAVALATGYEIEVFVNGVSVITDGNYQFTDIEVTGLSPNAEVLINVTPIGSGQACFEMGTQSCNSIPCDPNIGASETVTICFTELPYTWNGQQYTEAGEYSVVLQSEPFNCDSTVVLTLNVDAPAEPTIECWETLGFDDATCQWVVSGDQPVQPEIECYQSVSFNDLTCSWDITGTQPEEPVVACYETATFNDATCSWDITGTQPEEPVVACYETATFNDATCAWDITGTQPEEPTVACYETSTFNDATCSWDITGTQPEEPVVACYETATFNDATCSWDITGTQPEEPVVACYETATFNDATCSWDITGTQPEAPATECYETAAFNDLTCSWDVSGSQTEEPTVACYETATFNDATCVWDITGTPPEEPTVACYETATFNDSTCSWDITGTQPEEPVVACYETATFNDATCSWDITGTQPEAPATECYETATFNDLTCSWDVSGSQTEEPTVACYETATFNDATCAWDITGTQPEEPVVACYETATFNDGTCAWDITGTQPEEPVVACYETATFNDATCTWDITGTQPEEPVVACYETATFNDATCTWDITGTQPEEPTVACYETATFNDATCSWDITGTQPEEPVVDCYETATFNDATCVWDITGTQPEAPATECYETATFNDLTCSWDVSGSQTEEPTVACYETATFNDATCAWDITGTQPEAPATECYETATFNDVTCSWDVSGSQTEEPTVACYETATFNDETCAWDISGTQPEAPATECYETATFNDVTCSWDVSGSQPEEPIVECWETVIFNDISCAWEVSGTQPEDPLVACYETASFNEATCAWEISGIQPEAPVTECWETSTFNDLSCQWVVTGTQPEQPVLECWETTSFNDLTCQWDVQGEQPLQPDVLNCWDNYQFNEINCAWENLGSPSDVPTAAIIPSGTLIDCNNSSITLTASGIGSYTWTDGSGNGAGSGATITVSQGGTYTLIVTSANGCEDSDAVTITQDSDTPVVTIDATGTLLDCETTTITLSASATVAGGTYSWSNGSVNTNSIVVSAADNYEVTFTADNGCETTDNIGITEDSSTPQVQIVASEPNITCDVTEITLTASGADTYVWSTGETVSSIVVTTAGPYSVTGSTANGCDDVANFVVGTDLTPPVASISAPSLELTCDENEIILTATGGGTYDWNNGLSTSSQLTVSNAGVYSVVVEAANGCTDEASVTVSQDADVPVAEITASEPELNCTTTSLILTGTGGAAYSWGAGLGNEATLIVNAPGIYTLTVTASNGCQDIQDYEVLADLTEPFVSIVNLDNTSELTCTITEIDVQATGAIAYSWSNGLGFSDLATITQAGTYTVTGTADNGCSADASIEITSDGSLPVVDIVNNTGTDILTCNDPTIEVTVSSSISGDVNWSNGLGTNPDQVFSTPGTYSVTVIDPSTGCEGTASVTIGEDVELPIVDIFNSTGEDAITCVVPSIDLFATGGVSYVWTNGGVQVSSTADVQITNGGTYTVVVTGSNGCQNDAEYVIGEDTVLPVVDLTASVDEVNCTNPVSILTASGGGTYAWSGGLGAGSSVNVTSAGLYTVTVTGDNGCEEDASISITENFTEPGAFITADNTELNCTILSATLTANGNGSYEWGNGLGNASEITVTEAGLYTLTVTGSNGCTSTDQFEVTEDITPVVATVTPSNAQLTCTAQDITLTAGGGVSYEWSNGLTGETISVNAPDTYTVIVTGSNGCTDEASAVVSQSSDLPVIVINATEPTLNCDILSSVLTASGANTYTWTNEAGDVVGNSATLVVSQPGVYTATGLASNGCTGGQTFEVLGDFEVPNASILNVTGTDELTCAVPEITLEVSGGASYQWNLGLGVDAIVNIENPNSYSVVVTGANGCDVTLPYVITEDIGAPVVNVVSAIGTFELNCTIESIEVQASGGFTYEWSNGLGFGATQTLSAPGTYQVTALGENGCQTIEDVVITQDLSSPSITITNNSASNQLDCLNPGVSLTASGAVTYEWFDALGNAVGTDADNIASTPGVYTVIGIGVNGCDGSQTFEVFENTDAPAVSLNNLTLTNELTCSVTSINVEVVYIDGTLSWSETFGGADNISITDPGSYIVTLTAPNGCTNTASIVITEDVTVPGATINNLTGVTQLDCLNPSIELEGLGNGTVGWSGGSVIGDNTEITSAGNYTLTVTGLNGCESTSSLSITEDLTAPVAVINATPDVTQIDCINQNITLTAAGGVLYVWMDAFGAVLSNSAELVVDAAGDYTVEVTAANGCVDATSIFITEDTVLPTVSIVTIPSATELTCALVEITLSASGADVYEWTNIAGDVLGSSDALIVNAPGTYTATGALENGCVNTNSIVITQDVTLPGASIANPSGETTLTCDLNEILLQASGNGSFSWSNGGTVVSNSTDLTVGTAGTYTLTVTGSNGCTSDASIVIDSNGGIPVVSINNLTGQNVLTCSTEEINVEAAGAGVLEWTNASGVVLGGVAALTITEPGDYTVTLTASNGCDASANISITEDIALPVVDIINTTGSDVLTCDLLSINLTATGGVSYEWSGGEVGADLVVTADGTYTVTATGANGCENVASYTITEDVVLPTVVITNATNTTELTCDVVQIDVVASGADSYVWTDATGAVVSNSAAFSITEPGEYTAEGTSSNGCSNLASITITEDVAAPIVVITNLDNTQTLTCQLNVIDLVASGGVEYSWSNGSSVVSTTADLAVGTIGTYTVTVTGANGCSSQESITIDSDGNIPVVTIDNLTNDDVLTCSLTSINAVAQGSGTFEWTDASGVVLGGVAALTITEPGDYTVTLTASNGCDASANISITEDIALPVVDIINTTGSDVLTCDLLSINLTATGGVSYEWSGGEVGADLVVTADGTYTVTASGANGCENVASYTITEDVVLPTVVLTNATNTTELTCDVVQIDVVASGADSYVWTDATGAVVSNSAAFSITEPGEYTAEGTSSNGCSNLASITITEDVAAPIVVITNLDNTQTLTCQLNVIDLVASGGVEYSWSNGSSVVSTTADLAVGTIGTYTVTVTGANGCSSQESVTIDSDGNIPVVTIDNLTNDDVLTCSLISINVVAQGSGTFEWTDASGVVIGGVDALTITEPGDYTVTLTASNGCDASANITITEDIAAPSVAIVNTTGTDVLSCVTTSISLTATGGVSYAWVSGEVVADITVSAGGTYTVTATGANGCEASASVVITEDNLNPAVSITNSTNETELTCDVPSVSLVGTGANSYVWTDASDAVVSSEAALNVSTAGTYTVTGTSLNGCSSTEVITITEDFSAPTVAVVSDNANDQLTCIDNSTVLSASGATSYVWANGLGTTSQVTVGSAGTYTVEGFGDNGCSSLASIVITSDGQLPSVTINASATELDCITLEATLTANSTDAVTWSNGLGNSSSVVVNAPGTYTVTATSANGCTAQSSVIITQDAAAVVAGIVNNTGTTQLAGGVTSISVTATGGGTYAWDNGLGNNATVDLTAVGTYTLTVTGDNGCVDTESITITNCTPPVVSIQNNTGTITLTCSVTEIELQATGADTYSWSNGLGNADVATITATGTYTVTGTTADGCFAEATIAIGSDVTTPTAGILNNTGTTILTCVQNSISVTAIGGGTYAWDNGLGSNASVTLGAAGTYTVTVTGANGCSDTESIVVTTDGSVPSPTITNNTGTTVLDCITTSIFVTANGGVSYEWSNGLGNNANATITTPGTYTVTATASNGCTGTATITVTEDLSVTAGITNNSGTIVLSCAQPTINVTATGGLSYSWDGGLGNAADATITQDGTYTVTVTAANGCVDTESVTITNDGSAPVIGITNNTGTTVLDCNNTSISLTATGGSTYTWDSGLGAGANVVITEPGTYTVSSTASNGCSGDATIVISEDIVAPVAGINSGNTVLTCSQNEIDVTATGGGSYSWSNGLGNDANATITASGTYSVTVTAANGCTDTESVSITDDGSLPQPTITSDVASNILDCLNGTITLTAGGSGAYSWSNGATNLGSGNSIVVSDAGIYTLTVTSSNGCFASTAITISEDAAVSASIVADSPFIDCNNPDMLLTASGGVSYAWSNGLGNAPTASVNAAGDYTVTVTAANGCTAQETITVIANFNTPNVAITNNTGVTVLGCNNNAINVTATGAINYQWSGGLGNTASVTITTPGAYTVTGTGANGCISTASIAITQDNTTPTAGITNSTGSAVLTCSTSVINLIATGSGTYSWSNGLGNAANASVTQAGVYTVTVTATNGCIDTEAITITEDIAVPTAVIVNPTGNTQLSCAVSSIPVTATGGGTYNWSDGLGGGASVSLTQAGTYTVTVTGANGCTDTESITITNDGSLPEITIESTTTELNCFTTSIELTAEGDAGALTWSVDGAGCPGPLNSGLICSDFYDPVCGCDGITYSNPCYAERDGGVLYYLPGECGSTDGAGSIVVNNPGEYTVTLDVNGCIATYTISIEENLEVPSATVTSTSPICSNENASFTISGTTGDVVNYTTDGGVTTQSITIDASGSNDVVVNNPAVDVTLELIDVTRGNCFAELDATSTVVVVPAPTANASGPAFALCEGLTLSLTSQEVAGATYSWSGPGGFASSNSDVFIANVTTADAGEYIYSVSAGSCTAYDTVLVVVASPTAATQNIAICTGQSFELPDETIVTAAGTYTSNLFNSLGCDSTVTTNLTIVNEFIVEFEAAICEGESYLLPDGTSETDSGTYTFELISSGGCDSTVIINLVVNPTYYSLQTVSVCEGDSYTLPDGSQVSATDLYEVVFNSQFGCDSVVAVQLNVLELPEPVQIDLNLCLGETITLEDGTVVNASGSYPVVLQAQNGCDSLQVYNVNFWQNYSDTIEVVICHDEQYQLPNGQVVSESGDYLVVDELSAYGCDSTLVISVFELEPIIQSVTVPLCFNQAYVMPDGTSIGADGVYDYVLTSLNGCDSLVSIQLEVAEQIIGEPEQVLLCFGETHTLPSGDVVSTNGEFTSVLTSEAGCDSLIVSSVVALDYIFTEVAAFACQGETYTLPSGQNVSVNGIYQSVLMNEVGCDSTVQVTVTFSAPVVVSIIPEVDSLTVCAGDTLMLIADGASNFNWEALNPLSAYDAAIVEAYPSTSGYIAVTGETLGCEGSDSVYVTVNAAPEMQIVAPDAICMGDSVTITASGADSLLWLNSDVLSCLNCANNVVSPTENTLFTVGGWNGTCYSSTSFSMEVQMLPVASVFGDTLVCAFSPAQLFGAGGESYIWSTGETASSISVQPGETTIYQLIALSGICADTSIITVEAIPLPQITVNNDTTITLGGQVQLNATGGINYTWSPADDLSCTVCPNPLAIPSESMTYCVQALSEFGCTDTACLRIEVSDECETFFIPNAFAPERGGHEMNDCFRPFGEECFASMRMRVFDRWGELVFESTSFEECWDGNYQGKKVNSGVFVYYFDGVLINGNPFYRKGNVTVIR